MLAHLAEVEERKLYARAAYSSMHLYCVRELRMSQDVAYARIRAARKAREFPAIFPALADGRLNMTAVLLLAGHLTPETADELLAAAAHKTSAEIRLLLAERFPQPDMPTLVQAIAAPVATDELAAQRVEARAQLGLDPVESPGVEPAVWQIEATDEQHVLKRVARARLTPLSPGRFALQVTVDQETYDQLRYAQSLLGHAVPSGDVATVLKRALGSLVQVLEQRKLGKASRPRPQRSSGNSRYIPAAIRNAIWDRDGGQCTFVSEKGKRCEARDRLEFDHMDPVARGGQTTADRMQLRCRAHNQYTAECTFGAGFMRGKRDAARARTQEGKQAREAQVRRQEMERKSAQAQAGAQSEAAAKARTQAAASAAADVIPVLRELKFSAEEARRGAAMCADMPDAPLEERVRVALRGLAPPCVRRPAPVAS